MKSKVYSISDDEFINLVENSKSYSDCLRNLGLTTKGGSSSKILKHRIFMLNISTKHFEPKYKKAHDIRRKDLNGILVENSNYRNISSLKKRLISSKLLDYKCSICGNEGVWNNKQLTLQLDHINGINNDNRLENLRFLCPNCHSQTDTFSGKNLK